MKKLYCITSHCNTKDKIKALKETIKTLNDLNRDILLISHIPLSEDIIESVNYFIYDRSNPILYYPERVMYVWNKIPIDNKTVSLNVKLPDYGFTAINQFSRVASFCDNLDYDFYEFLQYDVIFTDEILNSTLNENFLTKVYDPNHGYRWPSLMWFGVTPATMKLIKNEWTRKDYVEVNLRDAEEYVEKKYTQYGFKNLDIMVEDKCGFAVNNRDYWFNFNKYNNLFKIFSDGASIILYDLVNPINFQINDNCINVQGNIQIYTPIEEIDFMGYYDYEDRLVNILELLKAPDDATRSIGYE